jgi:hypothetical protein
MIASVLIRELAKKDIKLKLKSGKLSIDAPKGAVTSSLMEELKLNKNMLLEYFNAPEIYSELENNNVNESENNNINEVDAFFREIRSTIPEDRSRLFVLKSKNKENQIDDIVEALKNDKVVLGENFSQEDADSIMFSIADKFSLTESLDVQAGFASSLGHRENVGKYYMTVNNRDDYQYIAPHSEGTSFTNIQLSSFFCQENTTDGGETILFNIDPSCSLIEKLREQVRRGRSSRTLTPAEIIQIKVMLRLNMPEDTLKEGDKIVTQRDVNEIFSFFEVLVEPQQTYSKILERHCFTYWDSIESVDFDSAKEMCLFLKENGLLKLPQNYIDDKVLDDSKERRIGNFGSCYDQLFQSKITIKLAPGDFVIQNNLTWCHSVSNWTPGSGIRKVAAAFA